MGVYRAKRKIKLGVWSEKERGENGGIKRVAENCKADYDWVEKLTRQRHDRDQTENQNATVDSCFELVGFHQHGVAQKE